MVLGHSLHSPDYTHTKLGVLHAVTHAILAGCGGGSRCRLRHHATHTLCRAGLYGRDNLRVGLTLCPLLALLLEANIKAAAQLLNSRATISALLADALTCGLRTTKTSAREVTHTSSEAIALACGALGQLLVTIYVSRVYLLQEAAGR